MLITNCKITFDCRTLALNGKWYQGKKTEKVKLLLIPVWYTDGSKISSGTGGGVFERKTGLIFSLGAFATLFQAEAFAIMAAIRESIARGYSGRTITIFIDSQAALKALESVTVKSKLVLECLGSLLYAETAMKMLNNCYVNVNL